mmetsp:Transcript_82936/g.192688  ORF Transcript_82936/g.192688 Transcript_82936/m.192688 type:complete len:85 (+) Transcript_82936:930-1184(+)
MLITTMTGSFSCNNTFTQTGESLVTACSVHHVAKQNSADTGSKGSQYFGNTESRRPVSRFRAQDTPVPSTNEKAALRNIRAGRE